MAENISLVTYADMLVTPQDDAIIYEAALGSGGVYYGCEVTMKNSNTLHLAAGHGAICGRKFTVVDSDIALQLSSGEQLKGRVYVHLDLSNTAEPIQVMTETADSLTDPIQQENVNIINGIYEFNIATFNVDAGTISEVVNVAPPLKAASGKKTEIDFNITSGVKFTATLDGYLDGMIVEAYLNGLRLKHSEYSISDDGVFTLANTLNTSGNELQVVVWDV